MTAAAFPGGAEGRRGLPEGSWALAQYIAREGRLPGRGVVQVLADGTERGTWLVTNAYSAAFLSPGAKIASRWLSVAVP